MRNVNKIKAFDIIYDRDEKVYMLVNVEYDLKSGDGKVIDKIRLDSKRHLALMKANEVLTKKAMALTTKGEE